jgi:hypothetical protein
MATLSFDGAGDWVRVSGAGVGAWNANLTVAAIVSGEGTGAFRAIFGAHSATQMSWEFLLGATHDLRIYEDAGGITSTGTTTNNTQDWLVGFSRATGTTTPTFHAKNLTTGGAWAHTTGSGSFANPRSCSGGYAKIGNFDNSPGDPGDGADPYEGDIGLVGLWDGVNMTNVQFEALATNLKTSDWYNHAQGTPNLLTELTSTSPTNIGSSTLTLAVTGAVLTGTDPTGWTFDGAGGVAEAPEKIRVVTSGLRW